MFLLSFLFCSVVCSTNWRNFDLNRFDTRACEIDVVSMSDLTVEIFEQEYLAKMKPVLIRDSTSHSKFWKRATRLWSFDRLGDVRVALKKDVSIRTIAPTDGLPLATPRPTADLRTLQDFVKYTNSNVEKSPHYLFDDEVLSNWRGRRLHSHYDAHPSLFRESLLEPMPKHAFYHPASKWFFVGPKRSGSSWHVDPNNETVWLTLVHGVKRWNIVEKHNLISDEITSTPQSYHQPVTVPALDWHLDALPHLSPQTNRSIKVCMQRSGDTIVIPSGTWHNVLNIEDTVGVTHNIINRFNFAMVFRELLREYEMFDTVEWFLNYYKRQPELFVEFPGIFQFNKTAEKAKLLKRESKAQFAPFSNLAGQLMEKLQTVLKKMQDLPDQPCLKYSERLRLALSRFSVASGQMADLSVQLEDRRVAFSRAEELLSAKGSLRAAGAASLKCLRNNKKK